MPIPEEHFVRRAELLACVDTPAFATQPFPVDEVRAGEFGCHATARESVDRLAVERLGSWALMHEAA
jgi:hypothetical protein